MTPYFNLIIFVFLFILMLGYLKLAKVYNILDVPNDRSSHTVPIIRGGGIIFPISILIYGFFVDFTFPYFFIAVILLSIISFVDDLYTMSSSWRFIFQIIASILVLFEVFDHVSIYSILLFPLIIGGVNAYNFMDGINGITAGYSLVSLASLLVANHFIGFVDSELILIVISSVVVFSFFNFRKKAICFSGDVGSISIAVIIIFFVLKLVVFTSNPIFFLFLAVYAIDTGYTLLSRARRRVNVLKPHREHLYQNMVDHLKWSHLKVTVVYSLIQLMLNFIVLFFISISSVKYSISFFIIFLFFTFYAFFKKKINRL
jgi:UDP-GlcNAc:undecaprenyl-phosphate/decaprenyl-phosphate GlcNAc-1-phosphate transferase